MTVREHIDDMKHSNRHRLQKLSLRIVLLALGSIPVSTIVMQQLGYTASIGNFIDFSAYWMAVERWQHGTSLYGTQDFGIMGQLGLRNFFPYLYPPAAVLLFYLYQFVPYTVGATLWGVTTAGGLWLAVVVLLDEYVTMTWLRRVALIPLILFFRPVWYAFTLGQITPLLAAFVTLSAVAMERSHRGGDQGFIGIGATLAAFVKPTAAPAGAVLLSDRRRLVGAALTGAVLYGVGVVVFGVEAHLQYLDVILHAKSGQATSLLPISQFHHGWFEPFDILGIWAWVPRIALLAGVALLSIVRNETLTADRAAFAAGAAIIPLAAPEGYSLSFVFYVPAAIVLAAERSRWIPGLVLALVASHWHAWILLELSRRSVATEIAVASQLGLYAGVAILGAAGVILWQSRDTSRFVVAWFDACREAYGIRSLWYFPTGLLRATVYLQLLRWHEADYDK